jgi:hypothetical protein
LDELEIQQLAITILSKAEFFVGSFMKGLKSGVASIRACSGISFSFSPMLTWILTLS